MAHSPHTLNTGNSYIRGTTKKEVKSYWQAVAKNARAQLRGQKIRVGISMKSMKSIKKRG